jgi:hypothetical protein
VPVVASHVSNTAASAGSGQYDYDFGGRGAASITAASTSAARRGLSALDERRFLNTSEIFSLNGHQQGVSAAAATASLNAVAAFGSGSGSSGGGGGALNAYLSEIEQTMIRSSDPIQINASEEITVNGHRGIWANRAEVVNWRGPIPITQYAINEDASPEIITKRSTQTVDYVQELAIRYCFNYWWSLFI